MAAFLFASAATASKDYTALFSSWKAEHHKVYQTGPAEAKAFAAFVASEDKITAHNGRGESFTMGHNEWSDLTSEEFFAKRLGYRAASPRPTPLRVHRGVPLGTEIPEAVDWVTEGKVTGVKNQAVCGSCWSFSTTGAIEGAYAIASGSLVSLSEEELVQCNNHTDHGCEGGLMDNAFEWVKANGITTESAYPYSSGTGITGLCKSELMAKPAVTIGGFVDVAQGDEAALKSAVAQQPVSIAIEADKGVFQHYKSGVMGATSCGMNLDHGVLVVGYGSQPGLFGSTPYWKVKNSWGATWGEEGFIRIKMGKNICGIAQQASYPINATAA